MSFADVNATVSTPAGVTVSRRRGRVVHPDTPSLPADTRIRRSDGSEFLVHETGAPVHFGDIPVERRWCVDDEGKLLEQRDFEDKHLHWYVLHFQSRNKEPDDPTSRPIPTVERFASDGIDPDGEHYRTIGFDPTREASGPVVRPEDFKPVTAESLDGYEPVRESDADKKASAAEERAAAAEAKADALEKQFAELKAAVAPKAPAKKETEAAKCGRLVTKGYVHMHERSCGKPECNQGEAA